MQREARANAVRRSQQPFEHLVAVGADAPAGSIGPVLGDHVGAFLRRQAAPPQGTWIESTSASKSRRFTDVLDRALHGQLNRPTTDPAVWADHLSGAQELAATILQATDDRPTWVYLRGAELMAIPAILRAERPQLRITLRLPVPWPAPELFGRLPWRTQLLTGALGADVVSVPSERGRKNLARSFGRYLGDVGVAARRGIVLLADGRRLRTVANPPALDVTEVLDLARRPQVDDEVAVWQQRLRGRRLVLAAERLHASSGLNEQLTAIERLLEQEDGLGERVAFVIVATGDTDASASSREAIESTVGRINGRFTQPGRDVPVQYFHGGVDEVTLAALYRLADVLVATPLSAGASVTVKEYVAIQQSIGGTGSILVSETSGTAFELKSLATCNPFDIEAVAVGITEALESDGIEKDRSLAAAATRIRHHDIDAWWRRELTVAADPKVALSTS